MKYVIGIILVTIFLGYGVRSLAGAGLSSIESATNIQKRSEERLKIIRSITDDREMDVSIVANPLAAAPQPVETMPGRTVSYVNVGDSDSVIVLRLGSPMTVENVGETQIHRYRSCNIVVASHKVIGWSIK